MVVGGGSSEAAASLTCSGAVERRRGMRRSPRCRLTVYAAVPRPLLYTPSQWAGSPALRPSRRLARALSLTVAIGLYREGPRTFADTSRRLGGQAARHRYGGGGETAVSTPSRVSGAHAAVRGPVTGRRGGARGGVGR